MKSIVKHQISGDQFDSLAVGYGDAETLGVLIDGQLSRRKLLLRALAQELAEGRPDDVAERFDLALALLADLEEHEPDVVTGSEGVLQHPYLGVWAMQCLRELTGRREENADRAVVRERLAGRLSYLTALAAVAAARAGRELHLDVVVPEGGLMFATHGLMSCPAGKATIDVRAGELTLCGVDGVVVRARPTLVLTTRPRPIQLEDQDPFRNAFGHQISGRLDTDHAALWTGRLAAAWQVITDSHRGYLPGLSVGLRSITPLAVQPAGNDASSATRHAFGAVASVLPPTGTRLALLLIHEFQHVKLGALLDLVQLLDESDTGRYHAPWRPDPRPLPALLQGAYAHLAVTDFWRRQRQVPGSAEDVATAAQQFSHWRGQTADVIEVMLGTSSLTREGRRFISVMGETIDGWQDDRMPAGTTAGRDDRPG